MYKNKVTKFNSKKIKLIMIFVLSLFYIKTSYLINYIRWR